MSDANDDQVADTKVQSADNSVENLDDVGDDGEIGDDQLRDFQQKQMSDVDDDGKDDE